MRSSFRQIMSIYTRKFSDQRHDTNTPKAVRSLLGARKLCLSLGGHRVRLDRLNLE